MSAPVISGSAAQGVFARWLDLNGIDRPPGRYGYSFGDSGCGFIYFARSESGSLKIGWSQEPRRRVRMQGISPVVFVSKQSIYDEGRLHRRLMDFAIGRSTKRPNRAPEWFAHWSPVVSLAFQLANTARELEVAA